MTNETTGYNAINIGFSESNRLQSTVSDTPIIGFGVKYAKTHAERIKRAEQIHKDRCGDAPADVIRETAKTEAGYYPSESWDEVPSIRDNYDARRDKLFSGGWENQDVFISLYNGDFGNYNQFQAESYLAAMFSFAFGKNHDIVAYEMEQLSFDTEYELNPRHRAYLFDVVEDIPSIYCEGIDLITKHDVAQKILLLTEVTVSDLDSWLDVGRRHISNVLSVLHAEGWVKRETSSRVNEPDIWKDDGLTIDYLDMLSEAKKRLEE
jgi:CRISPR/Cas system-associated exonuclease Cas4 (RecB family)